MTHQPGDQPRVVIVGSGFSGLCVAIKLKKAGIHDFVLLEKESDVGGTWRDNTYPGAACDVPSVLYSYSFRQNPNWTRLFPSWRELHAYLREVVDVYGLRPHLRFGVEVEEMLFDEPSNTWTVNTSTGESIRTNFVVNATGVLSKPVVPEIAGLESFTGTMFHSARWDHDHDFTGRRVAVIGTGASAVQFVPEVAAQAGQLYVFQRSPHWVTPREDQEIPEARRRRYRRLPFVQRLERWRTYWEFERLARGFLGHPKVVEGYHQRALEFLRTSVPDDELRARLTPDYTPGCKRRLVSDDWYPALQRPNVELVTTGLSEVTADSVVLTDGTTRKVDTIVFGTGFAATDFMAPMKVFGVGGAEISDVWKDGAATKLGISTSAFPNLFMMLGPNTALGHNSMVFMIEAQTRYIVGAIRHALAKRIPAVELRPEVQEKAYRDTQRKMKKTVWVSGCRSWYQSAEGRIDTLWPATTVSYWWQTKRFRPGDYR
ncbi:flavin-containing monooxygenase [Actinacidiphila oryziradicis]|uniref:NAD(P)/FAD-dependent oxidoreductase n=1 Tax=Actinacidiphila oryziradicis TaxID=2571141 RepID=A0A4U0S8S5_9ACTN|nr:NAD(P)/FAD-dependent oxidoreductase [Actinacidiphila oryziradicis]TKA04627.1 NAD(P)/FAD-dependent oxidoreductase [Actinacidiphila oryziradicis]